MTPAVRKQDSSFAGLAANQAIQILIDNYYVPQRLVRDATDSIADYKILGTVVPEWLAKSWRAQGRKLLHGDEVKQDQISGVALINLDPYDDQGRLKWPLDIAPLRNAEIISAHVSFYREHNRAVGLNVAVRWDVQALYYKYDDAGEQTLMEKTLAGTNTFTLVRIPSDPYHYELWTYHWNHYYRDDAHPVDG